jgi:hypothetical protein
MVDSREQGKREAIKAYFQGHSNVLAWTLIIVGIPFLFLFLVGLIPIILGVVKLMKGRTVASDAKIDAWTAEEWRLHDFAARAQQLSRFDRLVRPPVVLCGLATPGQAKGALQAEILGGDNRYRSTPIGATVLLCSPLQLGIYTTGIDLTTGNRINESFLEVFYQDVVAIGAHANTASFDFEDAETKLESGPTGFNVQAIMSAFARARTTANLRKLRSLLSGDTIAGILQFERSVTYRIDFLDGEHIAIPISDGRSTRRANGADAAADGDEAARNMIALRQFVREMKRQALKLDPPTTAPLV